MVNPGFGASSGLFPILLAEVDDNNIQRDCENTLTGTQEVLLESIYRLAADRVFFFGAYAPGGQLAEHNYVFRDADNEFSFDTVSGYNQYLEIRQWLGLTGPRIFTGEFGNYIGFENTTGRVYTATATNEFDFNSHDDPAEALLRAYIAANVFVFTQTINGLREEDVYNTFDFDNAVDSSGTEYQRDGDQGFIDQHVSFKVTGASCPEKEYTPFIGSSGDTSYPAVSATAPTLGSGVLTLTHPRVSPTTTLVLKNPEFGNTDTLQFVKIDRRTRGGDRKIFSDLEWGSTQSFELSIGNICSPDVDELIDFLNDSLGQEIGLLDWENRQWEGIIVAPETEVIPQRGGWRVRIIFEGTLA